MQKMEIAEMANRRGMTIGAAQEVAGAGGARGAGIVIGLPLSSN